MKKSILILRSVIVMLLTAITFNSCVDKDYDDIATANVDPALTATHTIKELQYMATGSAGVLISTDVIISGIVVGDDRTGNLYKTIILQQDSSGIAVQVDISNFYTEYPEGRRVFVKCKGLYIANDGGNFELGVSATNPVGRIPANLVSQYLVKGKWGQNITPKVYQVDATNIPTNTLVQFNNVEFENGGATFAPTSGSNLTFKDCAASPNTLVLYTSNYCTFAMARAPFGNGSLVGVYTVYSGDGEVQIRDTTDLNMNNPRCDGSTGVPNLFHLDSLRALDPGAANQIYLPGDKKIVVTVTSNYSTNMIGGGGQNIYVEDSTAGIQVRFQDPHTFALGTKLEINVSGMELSTFSGVLQINNVPLGNAADIGTLSLPPLTTTIDGINTNFNLWEGRVVKIDNVTITGSGTYSGVNTLTDATGTIELFTSSFATFASDPVPTGTVSVTGILTEYNGTKEILIRSPLDVQ